MCAQLITNRQFTRVNPMESKASSNIATALNTFFDDVGVPAELTCNLASEQTGKNTDVMKLICRLKHKTASCRERPRDHTKQQG
jgi:hypothetical protein